MNAIYQPKDTDLLDLALSIQQSGDMAENCRQFSFILKNCFPHSYCSIWRQDITNEAQYGCFFRRSRAILNPKSLPSKHALIQYLRQHSLLRITASDPPFQWIAQHTPLKTGTFTFVALSHSAFLCLYEIKESIPFPLPHLQQIFQALGNALDQDLALQCERYLNKTKEEELRRFQLVVENISEGLIISNLKQEITFVNDQILKLSGYERDEIVGKKVEDILLYKEQLPELRNFINQSFKGNVVEYEMAHQRKNSQEHWWAVINASPYRDSHGKIIGGIGAVRDITQQRLAEQALRESEERYRTLFENAFDGIMIFDIVNIQQIGINEKMLRLFDYTYEEFLRVDPPDFSPEVQANGLRSEDLLTKYRKKITDEGRIQYEWQHLKKDGSIFTVEVTTVNLPAPNNHLVIAIHKDITDRKEAEEALRVSEQRYRLLFENAFDGIVLFDSIQSIPINCNQKMLEYFRCTKEQFLSLSPLELSPEFQVDGSRSDQKRIQLLKVLENKQSHRYDWRHQRLDGSYFDTELTTFTLPAPDQHLRISILKDITEKKEAERTILKSEARFRSIFEQSPFGLNMSKGVQKVLTVNPQFCEMLGYEFEKLDQKFTRLALIHPEDQAGYLNKYKQLQKGKARTIHMKKRFLRKEGSILWGNLTISRLNDEQGNMISDIAFVEDITARKFTDDALQFISSQVATSSGKQFFRRIVKSIAQTFDISYVLIGEVDGQTMTGTSRAFWAKGKYQLAEYDLSQSPCVEAFQDKKIVFIPEAVKNEFPHFDFIQDHNVQSYLTMPLTNSRDQIIGHIALMNEGAMFNIPFIKNILKIYSTRVSSELERQKNELFIQEGAAKLREAQRLAKIGNWEYDPKTNLISWSEEIFRILKRDPKLGPPTFDEFSTLVHPDDQAAIEESVALALSEGKPWELESRFLADGKIIYTVGKGKALREHGATTKIFGTVQDISDKKVVELDLIETSRKYQDLFENMYDALIITDSEGRFVDSNKAAHRLLEYNKEQLAALRIPEIVYPEDKEKSYAYLQQLITDGYYSDYQGRIITRSGKVKYLQVNSNAIYENGKMIGSRDIARDITALKEAEQKKEQLYLQLEQANQELKDFAYIVSHDLKAPLRAIGALSQWIAEDYAQHFDEEGRQHLNLLTGRVKRMHNFIEGILEYSRIGRIKMKKEEIDIQEMINNVIDSLAPPEHFEIQSLGKMPKIIGERIRIQQVFQNLISNSIKYNDKEKGLIQISYNALPTFHQFSIKDNGIGIADTYFEKIFQIFQTLLPRDQFESTGIGLTIVKRIVELHGGTITLHSIPKQETTFVFTLKKV